MVGHLIPRCPTLVFSLSMCLLSGRMGVHLYFGAKRFPLEVILVDGLSSDD